MEVSADRMVLSVNENFGKPIGWMNNRSDGQLGKTFFLFMKTSYVRNGLKLTETRSKSPAAAPKT